MKASHKTRRVAKQTTADRLVTQYSEMVSRLMTDGSIGLLDVPVGANLDIAFAETGVCYLANVKKSRVGLSSRNGWSGITTLKAACMAVSICAMNWVSWQAASAGDDAVGKIASDLYHRMRSAFAKDKTFTEDERQAVLGYLD